VASAWISTRDLASGRRYRVMYRLGGREDSPRYGGSFRTLREAKVRRDVIAGELASLRVPSLRLLTDRRRTFAEAADAWRESRRDVRDSTAVQHRVALKRALPALGYVRVDEITVDHLNDLVRDLAEKHKARATIRRTVIAVAMVLDHELIEPNPARDHRVKLPVAEPVEIAPPEAAHVERVAAVLTPAYRLALYVLDATGCRVGELEKATVGDLDEAAHGWLVRGSVSKTRRPRLVVLPPDLWRAMLAELPPREDRHEGMALFPGVSADRLRTAIARACKATGTPVFSPHDLRHRRITLLLKHGDLSLAEVGAIVGQKSSKVTLDTYGHVLLDHREIVRGL
jgi:integrase